MRVANRKSQIASKTALLLLATGYWLLATLSPQSVFAQNNTVPDQFCDEARGTCQTDIGEIGIDPSSMVNTILNFAVGIGGGLALVLIIWGGFRIITSSGNPEEVKKGKEIITYAIIGLILILFAVVIMNVVGGGILGIRDIGV